MSFDVQQGEFVALVGPRDSGKTSMLVNRLDHYPSELSGGQQQRVAIACAPIHEPAVVLADKPTANLDTTLAHQVVETLAHLIHEQNRAGIMVTHDLRMARYVDKVIQMKGGKINCIIEDRAEIDALAERVD